MPYQGKEARERLRWMTLAEAVDHVVLTEHCERVVALSEIRLALGEGDIPGRWAASPLPAGFYPLGLPPIFSSDNVRIDHEYWSQVLILLDPDCRAVDRAGPRQLLLLRSRVLELWAMDMEHSGDRSLKQDQKLRSASKDQLATIELDCVFSQAQMQ